MYVLIFEVGYRLILLHTTYILHSCMYVCIYLKATFVDCKSVFVIHVKSYKLQGQFMLRSRERGNIQLLNGMCREAQECIRHD